MSSLTSLELSFFRTHKNQEEEGKILCVAECILIWSRTLQNLSQVYPETTSSIQYDKILADLNKMFTKFANLENLQIVKLQKIFGFHCQQPSAAKTVPEKSMLNVRQMIFGKVDAYKLQNSKQQF